MSAKQTEIANKTIYDEVEKLIIYGKNTKETATQLIELMKKMDEEYSNDIGDNVLIISAKKSMSLISSEVLHNYIKNENYEQIKYINEDLENVLMIFIKRNNVELFEIIVKNEHLTSMLEQKNKYGKTIFSFIKDYGRNEMLDILKKYNINQTNIQKQKVN